MGLKIADNQTLLMIGDSITDAGRGRPVGTAATGLGEGYVNLVNALLTAAYPKSNITVLNTGESGNTVRNLNARWRVDVLDLKPDWLTIMIGTNDVWRQFDDCDPAAAVQPDEFASTLTRLVQNTAPLVSGLVLMTPFLIETSLSDPFRARMDEYTGIVKAIGLSNDVAVVDTQAAYDKVLKFVPSADLSDDRVHPNVPGHMVLAKAVLTALGFSWT
jgi:lysophospholipase L1-like esterase